MKKYLKKMFEKYRMKKRFELGDTYLKKFLNKWPVHILRNLDLIYHRKNLEFEIDILGDPEKINYNLPGNQVENIGNRIISIP